MAIKWMLPTGYELPQEDRATIAGKAVAMRLRPGTGPQLFFGPRGLEIWMIEVAMSGEITLRPLPVEMSGEEHLPLVAVSFTFADGKGERGGTRVVGGSIEKDDYFRMVEYLMRPHPSDPGRRRTGLNIGGSLSAVRLHGTKRPTRTHMKAGTLLARIADEPQQRRRA